MFPQVISQTEKLVKVAAAGDSGNYVENSLYF